MLRNVWRIIKEARRRKSIEGEEEKEVCDNCKIEENTEISRGQHPHHKVFQYSECRILNKWRSW